MTSPSLFTRIMGELEINHADYTFIDFGCGKGAPLFYAAAHPFRQIIGVEFVRELTEVAQANANLFKARNPSLTPVEAVCADAALYSIPKGPWVLFFNAPFEAPVCESVMDNIARAPRPRDPASYLVLVNGSLFPGVHRFFVGRKDLAPVHAEPAFDVYRLMT